MTQRGVEIVLGRLATDEEVRRRFTVAPLAALRELAQGGVEITSVEMAALEAVSVSALQRFAQSLDPRLQRAVLVASAHRGEEGL